ncbi:TPA: hypothetical protein LUK60_004900 [Escherichia coli]|nr:hypothetical protein [Escherichia coli]
MYFIDNENGVEKMSNFHNEHVMQFYRNNLKTKGVFGK